MLLISDRGTADLPNQPPRSPDVATATRSALALAVRHVQDTELVEEPATVTVNVFVDAEPDGATDFNTTLDLSTGVLEVGDAEAVEHLELGAGQWDLALIARPADHPDNITIWLSPNEQTSGAKSSRHAGAKSG